MIFVAQENIFRLGLCEPSTVHLRKRSLKKFITYKLEKNDTEET